MNKWNIIIITVFSINTFGIELNPEHNEKNQYQFDYKLLLSYYSIDTLVKKYNTKKLCQTEHEETLFAYSVPTKIMTINTNFYKIKRDTLNAKAVQVKNEESIYSYDVYDIKNKTDGKVIKNKKRTVNYSVYEF